MDSWVGRLCRHFGLDPSREVTSGVLAKVVLSVKTLVALGTHVALLTRVNDKVQCELLFALERLGTDGADKRTLGVVTLLVPGQVVLALQPSAANVTDEAPLHFVAEQVLL
jgi:hypothetical protein